MSKFIGYTIGLGANGHEQVGKMVKVEYSKLADGRVKLQATSGNNLSSMSGSKTISAQEFEGRPTDPYDQVGEARWALGLCGWTAMGTDE